MKLSLVNKFTPGTDESTSMSDMSELSIFIKYVNPITNTLFERFLRLVLLGSSKSDSALYKAIAKAFSDRNLKIKNKFFNVFDWTNTMSSTIGGLQRYMRFESRFSKYISYKSHRFAHVFVHLTRKQEVSREMDSLLLQLWKKFKFSTRKKSVLEGTQQVQGNLKTLKILKASAT